MSQASEPYVSLICGLPNPERLFLAKLAPISRLKLEQRLKQLSPQDQQTLDKIENVLNWRYLSSDQNDRMFIKTAKALLLEIASPTIKRVIRDKLEVRTCVAALRRRARGESSPGNTHWGVGRWVEHINQHWHEPNFGLEHVFSWLPQVNALFAQGEAEDAERLLLENSFRQLQRSAGLHAFDFEAVVIYVLKWNIIDRSSRYNTEAAKRHFDRLVSAGLGEFNQLNFKESA